MTDSLAGLLGDDLEGVVTPVMAEWKIPGMALAVIRKDDPPLLRAFGLRDVEARMPVETTTVFPICSLTKSFTATGLALLVDEGKLDWDAPVRGILPEFKLWDPVATEQATLRDLLTHRTGLPRHDWAHMSGHLDNAGMLAALRHLEPSEQFRSTFQYQNLMYLVAGMVIERITGQDWGDFIKARIFRPLEITEAVTSLQEMVSSRTNHAAPYMPIDEVATRIPLRPINTHPAGAICASIRDMAAYLRFHLNPLAGQGGLKLSVDSATQLSAPQVYVGRNAFTEIGDTHYGFGFETARYRGERRVTHGGGWSGYTSDLRMLPDRGLGVIVLTNGHSHPGCGAIGNVIFDRLLGLDPIPWFDRVRRPTIAYREQRPKDTAARAAATRQATRPSHDLLDYAGKYAHPAYGEACITCADGKLRWQGLSLDLSVMHRHYDVFDLGADPGIWFENRTLQFHTDREGNIESVAVLFEPAVAPIVFRRRPDPETTTRAFLEKLTGRYERCGVSFRIAIDDSARLTFTRGDGPVRRLEAGPGGMFALVDDPNIKLEFRRNASNAVDAMWSHEPTGVYPAERAPPD